MTAGLTEGDATRYTRWQGWAKTIAAEMWLMLWHQHFWTSTRDALGEHQPHADGVWLRHYSRMYADAQMMTLRRLTDRRKDVVSITKLLRAMQSHPHVVTCDRFVELPPIIPGGGPPALTAEEQRRRFDPRCVFEREYGDGSGYVRPKLIKDDLAELERVMVDVKVRADKLVAHLSANYDRDGHRVTYADVRTAIDQVVEIGGRWVYLFQGHQSWWPLFLNDWQEPLREPVFRPQ